MLLPRTQAKFADKVTTFPGWLFYTVLCAALILACSELGRMLGLPGAGLKISIFWPAAGVALSALLLFGMRLLPGVFLGSLIYNTIHLIPIGHTQFQGVEISVIFSLGSTLQAALAYYILLRYASVDFFNRFRDTLIFLLPAGMLACVVASAMSVGTLVLAGYETPLQGLYVWVTFWIGDTIGIYLVTPLVIGWIMSKPMVCTFKTVLEATLLSILLIASSFAIFFGEYPLAHLLLPFILWGTFRFHIRGASICLLLVSAIAIIATAAGYGPFAKFNRNEALFFLITFLNIVSATVLVLISVLNERERNASLLKEYNTNLEEMVEQRTKQLHKTQEELQAKEKLASLGVLASGISHEIRHPLAYIRDLAKTGEECTLRLKDGLKAHAADLPELTQDLLQTGISTIEECLQQIGQNEQQALQIVNLILKHSRQESISTIDFQPLDLHNLLDGCMLNALHNFETFSTIPVKIIKEYDPSIQTIVAIHDDLQRVFSNLMENALYALKLKVDEVSTTFDPSITIKTKNYSSTVEITIRDNGIGMSDAVLRRVFQPFFSTKPLGEGAGLGLALSYDIVVQEHHGNIVATSRKGIFTEVVITLPKKRGPGTSSKV